MTRIQTILGLLLLGACTAQQRAETARAADVFACEVAVLQPYVPEALDAEKLVQDIVTGVVPLDLVLVRLGAAEDQVHRAMNDFNVCFAGAGEATAPAEPAPAPEPMPAGEQSRLVAPPPAYGNRVL